MDIFLIYRRPEFVGYGQVESAVVVAENADCARLLMAQTGYGSEGGEVWYGAYVDHIGTSVGYDESKVIMTSRTQGD